MYGSLPTLRVSDPSLGDVVEWMRRFAHKGKSDLRVRRLVEVICAELEPGDYGSEALAIYGWCHANIRYMRDIHDVEFVKEPAAVIASRSGDCDDIATLVAAMLMTCGNQAVFTLVGFDGSKMPSHVYCNVVTPRGKLVPLDTVSNTAIEEAERRTTWRKNIPV
jgi:transglutaminase-like putative cysteine protease